jgi:hypothetical protein
MTESSTREAIVAATQHWLTRAVVGLNLCPFAKSVQVKDQIRYAVCEARAFEDVLAELSTELRTLADADPERIDTTLFIVPFALADFTEYNDALMFAERLLLDMKLDGKLQIASFHPAYQFDGTQPDDIENCTNRSPYPVFHLLREASIDRAVAAFPDAADIYDRNIETMRRLGHAGLKKWMDEA